MASRMQPRQRPRFSRSRSGCLTCRARKKKCDEAKPRCAGCRRNRLVCSWAIDGLGVCEIETSLEEQTTQAVWQETLAPAPSSALDAGSERACGLTPHSSILLAHYVGETVSHFAMTPLSANPFLTVFLPLACVDDLLMHAMLAFSGAHLTNKARESHELARATGLHYAKMVAGLRQEVTTWQEGDVGKSEKLVRVLIVACHYEALSGNTQEAMFSHLQASRALILSLAADKRAGQGRWHSAVNLDALGFCLELYAFVVLSNSVAHSAQLSHSFLRLDPYPLLQDDLASFSTFGALFAGSHELFYLIPEVSRLALLRLAQEAGPADSAGPSEDLRQMHDDIHRRVTSWELPQPPAWESAVETERKRRTAEVIRHTLLVYLATAYAGSVVSDPAVRRQIQDHLDATAVLVLQILASGEPANLLWPILVAGTCLVRPADQAALVHFLRTRFRMRHMDAMADALQLLWDDPDPRAYGPYGLHWTMRKHGINIGMA